MIKIQFYLLFGVVLSFFIIIQQHASGVEHLTIRVWLAGVDPHTGKVQICIDLPDSGASSCKKIDADASRRDSLGKPEEPIIIDGGLYTLPLTNSSHTLRIVGCVYVFKYDTGYCNEDKNNSTSETKSMLLFTTVKPVYYDKDAGRLFKFGECYKNEDGSKRCFEDEGVTYPDESTLKKN